MLCVRIWFVFHFDHFDGISINVSEQESGVGTQIFFGGEIQICPKLIFEPAPITSVSGDVVAAASTKSNTTLF